MHTHLWIETTALSSHLPITGLKTPHFSCCQFLALAREKHAETSSSMAEGSSAVAIATVHPVACLEASVKEMKQLKHNVKHTVFVVFLNRGCSEAHQDWDCGISLFWGLAVNSWHQSLLTWDSDFFDKIILWKQIMPLWTKLFCLHNYSTSILKIYNFLDVSWQGGRETTETGCIQDFEAVSRRQEFCFLCSSHPKNWQYVNILKIAIF